MNAGKWHRLILARRDRAIVLILPLLMVSLSSCQQNEPALSFRPRVEEQAQEPPTVPKQPTPELLPLPKTDGLPKEVAVIVGQLLREFPRDPEALLACGAIFDYCGKSDEAIQCWTNCVALDPTAGEAYERIAIIEHRRGQFEEAAQHLAKACEVSPELPDAELRLGKTLLDLGRLEEAVEILERRVTTRKRNEEWFWLGQAHFQLRNYERAKECYEESLALNPEATAGWFGLAQVCDRLGDTERAKRCRERFTQLDDEREARTRATREPPPTDDMATAHACQIAGNIFARRERLEQAEAHWRRAAKLNPANTASRESLARALVQQGRHEEALLIMEELQILQPENIQLLLVLAGLYERTQNAKAVEQCLQEAVAIAPDDPVILTRLARLYLDRGQELSEARSLAERAVRMQPSGENFFLLSAVCLANQDRPGARQALRAALELEPRNPKFIESAKVLGSD